VEDRLFATLDPSTRVVELEPGMKALVTDTVGFIRKLPHHLVASFRATLEEAQEADLLVHVIDISHPGWEEQKFVVDEVLAGLGLANRETILAFNKVDRLTHDEEQSWMERAAATYQNPSVFISTVEPGGVEPLREMLKLRSQKSKSQVRITLPASNGAVLAEIYREGEVLEREDEGEEIHLKVRLPAAVLGRLRRQPEIVVGDGR
jgi:GTPase